MFRSMFSAISGIRNHQLFMDAIGNNIANVNTTAFKGSRVAFQDLLSQTLRGALKPADLQAGRGGVNALQVGLGAVTATTDTIQTQGYLQNTNRTTDLAIQGDGFFILTDGTKKYYTRDGNFDLGDDGKVISTATGFRVLGWTPDATGVVDPTTTPGTLTIKVGGDVITKATSKVSFVGNLNSATAVGGTWATTMIVYDSLGLAHELKVTFTRRNTGGTTSGGTVSDDWNYAVTTSEAGVTVGGTAPTGVLTFSTAGQFASTTPATNLTATPPTPNFTVTLTNGAATPQTLSLDYTALKQLAQASSAGADAQDGYTSGTLLSFAVTDNGEILGTYSNGQSKLLGQLSMATFANAGGLQKLGSNLLFETSNSGLPQVGAPNSASRGQTKMGFLEGSNIDLAQQFTNMIIAQRGFQSNSRIVTTTDEMLQDLVNLKR